MQMLIRDKGKLIAFRMLPEDYHIDDRLKGFRRYCAKCPNIRVLVYEIEGDQDKETRADAFRRILADHPDLKGIFVPNASTHQAAEFIRSRSQKPDIHIIGYDLVEENIRYLRAGSIDFLISQQSERQGYEGLYTLYRHVVLEEKVPDRIMMQLDIVTSENIDYYHS